MKVDLNKALPAVLNFFVNNRVDYAIQYSLIAFLFV